MAGEIKQRIQLDGEKEYNAALRDAQRNLKTLRSELKAETAEMGVNATAQQKNEARSKSLQKQIREQEKVVETLRKALEEAKKDYGDNEDVVQKWEQKLNAARTTLANMGNELGTLENGMRGASSATAEGVTASKSFADAVQSIATIGDSVSSTLQGIFTGLVDTVRQTVEQLWDFIGQTAEKANQWTDIAGYWNTDASTIQQWAHAVGASANSFNDLEAAVSRINLGGKGKEITELLGVSKVNYNSDWDYAIAVLDRLAELRGAGQDTDEMWETIFGEKKATKVIDLINDWETVQKNLATFDAENGGFGTDEETLSTMNDIWTQMQEIEEKWATIQQSVAGGLGTITADLLINVSGSLDALNAFMKADTDEDREAALENLKQNITEFFEKVKAAIQEGLEILKEIGTDWADDDDPVIAGIGKLLLGIEETLQWIIDNADAVGKALLGIFGAGLMVKLGTVALQIAGMVAQLKVISAFNGLGAAAGGAGAAGSGAAAGGGAVTGAGLKAALTAAGAKEIMQAAMGVGGSLAIAGGMIWAGYERNTNENIRGSENAITKAAGGDEEALALLERYIKAQHNLEEYTGSGNVNGPFAEFLYKAVEEASEKLLANDRGYDMLSAYSDWRQENSYGSSDWAMPEMMKQAAEAGIAEGISKAYGENGNGQENTALTDGLNGLKGLPALISSAVVKGVSGIKVYMDGVTVGNLVAPTVSYAIGGRAYPELR
jgi:hypothetical protein